MENIVGNWKWKTNRGIEKEIGGKDSNESKWNEREMGRRRCSDGMLVDEMENGDK